jgi:pimeloyl-ACP methyl ester carboxylesterase
MPKSKAMNIHYTDEGRGPALVLIHAFPLDHTMWRSQIDHFKGRFRVVAPDLRGFGKSRPAMPWTIDDACEDIRQILDTLGIENCALAGLSMGGYVSLPFQERYPGRVNKLILANTRARADNDAEKSARTAMIAALEQGGAAILPDRMLPRLLGPNASPQVVQLVRSVILNTDPQAAIYAVMAMRDRADKTTVLHRIDCPALVISGEDDVISKLEEGGEMAAAIPGGRFAAIPKAGHLTNLENPQAFNKALEDFLA